MNGRILCSTGGMPFFSRSSWTLVRYVRHFLFRAKNHLIALGVTALVAGTSWAGGSVTEGPVPSSELCRTDWLYRGEIGLSSHYFATNTENRERVINAFKVQTVANQAAEAGASWFLLPLHHQSWIMSAANKTFDQITGTSDYTTQRDLPLELQHQLEKKGIKLMLYVNLRLDPNSAVPAQVREAMGGWPPNDKLIENIAAVYKEYSLRYGHKVAGWWVDGAYLPEYRLSPNKERWFSIIADALRAGNPNALVTFNPGLVKQPPAARIARYTGSADFTAGESTDISPLPANRWVDGAQWHLWTYLGEWWGADGTRYSNDELAKYVSIVSTKGGALTFDVGTMGVKGSKDHRVLTPYVGVVDPAQIEQIKTIKKYLHPATTVRPASCGD